MKENKFFIIISRDCGSYTGIEGVYEKYEEAKSDLTKIVADLNKIIEIPFKQDIEEDTLISFSNNLRQLIIISIKKNSLTNNIKTQL